MSLRYRQWLFGWVNFALTAPSVYLWLGLPLVLRQHGWSGTDIGLFQLAGLPAVAKAMLALPVERWRPGARPYWCWSWLTMLPFIAALLGLAAIDADALPSLVVGLALLAALGATWADIPVSALAIQLFSPEHRPQAGGVRSASMFAGTVIGGGVMLLVQQTWGWAAPFMTLAASLLLALALLGLVREAAAVTIPLRVSLYLTWRGFLAQQGAPIWTLALLIYFPCVAAAWVFLKPLLLDRGFPVGDVALVAGVGGGALGALASLLAGWVPRRHLPRALVLSAAANSLALALLALASAYATQSGLLLAAAYLALAMGVAGGLAFAVMMDFARSHRCATDYGLQASIFSLGRILMAALAGVLLDRFGYSLMLIVLATAGLMLVLLLLRHRRGLG